MTEIDRIKSTLGKRETDELIQIWIEHDLEAWTQDAFEAISAILQDRGEILPPFGGADAAKIREDRELAKQARSRHRRKNAIDAVRPSRLAKYLIALLACCFFFFLYVLLGVALQWKPNSDLVARTFFMGILFAICGVTWRAITKRK